MNNFEKVKSLFEKQFLEKNNVLIVSDVSEFENQEQTNEVFSDKWVKYDKEDLDEQKKLFEFQKKWYLKLYGFTDEKELRTYLCKKKIILDAGCGLGYKAKWFADLSPDSIVIGMDYSDASYVAAKNYVDTPNLFFVRGDIGNTKIKSSTIDYVSCDQVIHHTENPEKTMIELSRILSSGGELAVYVYAKKALPRELLDDYFRSKTKEISKEDMWKLSEQLTELGRRLTELKINIDVPEIPLLGIKGGEIDLQRFIYWNFIKCFWSEELGKETSLSTNFDWYAPSNALRYSKNEFVQMVVNANLISRPFHSEEACHSGRFLKE